MDLSLLIRQRLSQLGYEQKDLAVAAQVTESYISQLLARKKTPPSSSRTDIYQRLESFLRLPAGELARLADIERQLQLQKKLHAAPSPLFPRWRELLLRKCFPGRQEELGRIFSLEPCGELEKLISRCILEVVQSAVRQELSSGSRLRLLSRRSHRSSVRTRQALIEFLEVDLPAARLDHFVSQLDPLLDSWDMDLSSFSLSIFLNPQLFSDPPHRFLFSECAPPTSPATQAGFEQFLADPTLSATATPEEISFLRSLQFPSGHCPTALYYYRELQSLRDPLHFPPQA